MYSLLTEGYRDALFTHTAQMGSAPIGILQTAATTSVVFIVEFFKSQNDILK